MLSSPSPHSRALSFAHYGEATRLFSDGMVILDCFQGGCLFACNRNFLKMMPRPKESGTFRNHGGAGEPGTLVPVCGQPPRVVIFIGHGLQWLSGFPGKEGAGTNLIKTGDGEGREENCWGRMREEQPKRLGTEVAY